MLEKFIWDKGKNRVVQGTEIERAAKYVRLFRDKYVLTVIVSIFIKKVRRFLFHSNVCDKKKPNQHNQTKVQTPQQRNLKL